MAILKRIKITSPQKVKWKRTIKSWIRQPIERIVVSAFMLLPPSFVNEVADFLLPILRHFEVCSINSQGEPFNSTEDFIKHCLLPVRIEVV